MRIKSCLSPDAWYGLKSLVIFLGFLVFIGCIAAAPVFGQRPRRATPTPASEEDRSKEQLERIRAVESADERISLLEKFIAGHHPPVVEESAREALMQEYSLKGEQDLKQGDAHLAMKAFQDVLRTCPRDITDNIFDKYIFPLPIAMNTFGFRAESAELMKSFESRFRDQPGRLVQIGFFYVQIEAPLEAVRVLEEAIRLAPNDHRAHNSLGTAYLINLRMDDAAAEFKKALDLDQTDEYANLNLANLLRAQGDYEGAIKYYQAQLRIHPDDPDAHGGIAIAYLANGNDDQATKEIAEAQNLGSENYRFYTELAYWYVTRKRYDEAKQMIKISATIEPRFAWTFITKADADELEGNYGEALSTIILAQQLGTFPTLKFAMAKAFMIVDGYNQAATALSQAFKVKDDGEFETTLGGVMEARSPSLNLLLARERQAALFLNIQPTTPFQYKMAEKLLLIDHYLNEAAEAKGRGRAGVRHEAAAPPSHRARPSARSGRAASKHVPAEPEVVFDDSDPSQRRRSHELAGGPLKLSAGSDSELPGMTELLDAIRTFTTMDDGRQAFRMVWVSRRLSDKEVALDAAIELAQRAILVADDATEPNGSMRDAPLLDRNGRRAVFLGRAEDALGWALLKTGDLRGAIAHLTRSVASYPQNQERKTALWHLAIATQQAGDDQHALDLFIQSYDPDSPVAEVRRSEIENLYKKVNGSLNGLDQKLKRPER